MSRFQQRCEDCGVAVTGRSHLCHTCNLRRQSARQSARRARQRAAKPVEVVGPWNPHVQPLLTRQIDYEPTPPSPALALQALEQAVAQSLMISGVLNLVGGKPHDQRVRVALAACRESGASNIDIDAAIQRGVRAGSGVRRVPSVLADETPEEVSLEDLLRKRVAV